jgi:hypothetical protein
VGVFWASGAGSDVYEVSHSSALGAATDRSVGWFEDASACDITTGANFTRGETAFQSQARFVVQDGLACDQLRSP